MPSIGWKPPIGSAAFAFFLAFLVCGAAVASDVEWQIPLIRDSAGSGLTLEFSREGNRQTATPFFTLSEPTARRFEDRIAKAALRLAAKMGPAEGTVAVPIPGICLGGTPREDSGRSQISLSSLPPLPGEITIRNVRNFLKALRASRKETPVPAEVVAVPERRLGRADTSPRGAD